MNPLRHLTCPFLRSTALAFKLWTEWGWRVYKVSGTDQRLQAQAITHSPSLARQMIGADISIRRYYLCYQVLVVLLKFDFL